jgi:phage tail-like protein
MTYPDLLPRNATPLERALASPTGRLTAIPSSIEDVWRHGTCPEDLLPWLAWAMSVDFWDEDWTPERKRNLIREAFELHRKKGTLYGIKRYLRYADAECLRAIVCPDLGYPSPSMTSDERRLWLSRFPQIRIYDYLDRGTSTKGAFCSWGMWGNGKTFLGAGLTGYSKPTCFPYETDAWERWGRRPFLWDQGPHHKATGVFKPVIWSARANDLGGMFSYDWERLMLPLDKLPHLFIGANASGNNKFNGRRFCMPSLAPRRVVTVSIKRERQDYEDAMRWRFAVPPSLEPINIVPELVYEPGTSKRGVNIFCGHIGRWLNPATKARKNVQGWTLGYLPPTTSRHRIYDLIALHDKDRLPNGKPATRHLGDIRLGMPPYHAELSVSVKGRRTMKQASGFIYGFTLASDMKHLTKARQAIVSAKSLRDKILMKTNLHTIIQVGPDTKIGPKTKVGRAQLLLT